MRLISGGKAGLKVSFNPRTRKGCDGDDPVASLSEDGFNPRTRKGCDAIYFFHNTLF